MSPHIVKIPLEAEGNMTTLSRLEVEALLDISKTGVYETFRRCCLAVLNSGNDDCDSVTEILERHRDFQVALHPRNGGIELEIANPPLIAFVEGEMIRGIREHLYAVLRDILFVHNEIVGDSRFDFDDSNHLTSAVFQILRNANVLRPQTGSRLAVCWGGHSIPRNEYEYTKKVGYQLRLRGLDICTGCGPGAMKGPMKGAAIGHSKQRNPRGRYVGVSEPGIIAAESPNPIVNQLVIMPDIEKRLEAFLRLGHAFVVFPGGVVPPRSFSTSWGFCFTRRTYITISRCFSPAQRKMRDISGALMRSLVRPSVRTHSRNTPLSLAMRRRWQGRSARASNALRVNGLRTTMPPISIGICTSTRSSNARSSPPTNACED